MEIILAIAVIFYYLLLLRFLRGIKKLDEIDAQRTMEMPFVSVVVAARNEEDSISECLDSLFRQTYAADNYEVILANDRSTDRTGDIAMEAAQRDPRFSTFVVEENPSIKGKSNALAQAVDRAKGEIIMMTDADCSVPPSWVEGIVSRFLPNVGIIGSATVQKAGTAWGGMQSLDWTYLHGIAAATIALRDPLSVIGNNLSFRKKAYEQVGGYRGIKFSVTEDFQLFKHIIASGEWDYRFPLDPSVTVVSKPCADLKTLVRQKHRWAKGGLEMKLSGLFLMFTGFLMHGAILFGLVTWWFGEAMLALLLKFIGDYIYLRKVLLKLNRTGDLKYFWAFEAYYASYLLFLPFKVLLGGKVRWKGRSF